MLKDDLVLGYCELKGLALELGVEWSLPPNLRPNETILPNEN